MTSWRKISMRVQTGSGPFCYRRCAGWLSVIYIYSQTFLFRIPNWTKWIWKFSCVMLNNECVDVEGVKPFTFCVLIRHCFLLLQRLTRSLPGEQRDTALQAYISNDLLGRYSSNQVRPWYQANALSSVLLFFFCFITSNIQY